MKQKELITLSFEMGKQGFLKDLINAPYANKQFMELLQNSDFGDDKLYRLRIKMYKSYIKGWTLEHIKSMVL